MSWFKRESGDYESDPGGNGGSDPAGKNVRTEGLWTKCLGCRAVLLQGGAGIQPVRLPQVPASLQNRRTAAHRPAA